MHVNLGRAIVARTELDAGQPSGPAIIKDEPSHVIIDVDIDVARREVRADQKDLVEPLVHWN